MKPSVPGEVSDQLKSDLQIWVCQIQQSDRSVIRKESIHSSGFLVNIYRIYIESTGLEVIHEQPHLSPGLLYI